MEEGKAKKHYTPEFKRDSVALLRSSNRPLREVAREIGVNDTTLGAWSRAEKKASLESDMTEEEKVEAEKLRKEIKDLKEEIEILKRFTTYWVKEQG